MNLKKIFDSREDEWNACISDFSKYIDSLPVEEVSYHDSDLYLECNEGNRRFVDEMKKKYPKCVYNSSVSTFTNNLTGVRNYEIMFMSGAISQSKKKEIDAYDKVLQDAYKEKERKNRGYRY